MFTHNLLNSANLPSPETIQYIPTYPFLLFMGFLIVVLIYFFIKCYKIVRQARTLQDIPTAKLRSAAQGYTELSGIQKSLYDTSLLAPLSRKPCTWYQYSVEYYSNKRWNMVQFGQSQHLFLLVEGDNRCIIDPTDAEISTAVKEYWYGFSSNPNGVPKNLIHRLWGQLGNYRYQEWRMEPEMPMYVIGNFETLTPTMLEGRNPELIHYVNQTFLKNINLVSGRGLSAREPFVLSSRAQHSVILRLKWQAFGWFVGYLLMLVICSWLLINRFLT